jgi:hypothetical protein
MLWFVINTDLTITTEKLVELFATMDDIHVQTIVHVRIDEIFDDSFPAAELDKQLDIPESKVNEMKMNLHSSSQRREAYLDLYATDHPCPSWKQVAEVLRSVGLHHQADTVESTYVEGRERYMYTLCVLL